MRNQIKEILEIFVLEITNFGCGETHEQVMDVVGFEEKLEKAAEKIERLLEGRNENNSRNI